MKRNSTHLTRLREPASGSHEESKSCFWYKIVQYFFSFVSAIMHQVASPPAQNLSSEVKLREKNGVEGLLM